jgi:hypothetical protein
LKDILTYVQYHDDGNFTDAVWQITILTFILVPPEDGSPVSVRISMLWQEPGLVT